MPNILRLIGTISRAEFIMPNLGSLILGLAWGATPTMSLATLAVLIILSFTIINGSSAIGAQINTLSDYDLDLETDEKEPDRCGRGLRQTSDTAHARCGVPHHPRAGHRLHLRYPQPLAAHDVDHRDLTQGGSTPHPRSGLKHAPGSRQPP